MALTIGSNIASLQAQRRLFESSGKLETVFERLASGQRINRASDDAAGLAISESLSADRRVFSQGVRNLNDGVSLLNIADSTIQELSSIVIRLQELAQQSSNGSLGVEQRGALDAEAQELSEEYTRIIQTASFNGQNIFDGEFGTLRLQAGYGLDGGIASGLGGAVGDGSFGEISSFSVEGQSTRAIKAGDLNGDGIQDLVTAGRDGGVGFVTINLGNGDGTFTEFTSFQSGPLVTLDIVLEDFNGDGTLDIFASGTAANGQALFLGNGDGSFGAAQSLSFGEFSQAAAGDVNGDGILDLVGISPLGSGAVTTVALGNGDGTFAVAFSEGSGLAQDIGDPVLADFNNDGILDVVGRGDGGLILRFGNGDGTFGSEFVRENTGDFFYDVVAGDLDGDGNIDLVGNDDNETFVIFGDGEGNFGSRTVIQSGSDSELTLSDIDGNGTLDLVIGENAVLTVFSNDGQGTFSETASYVNGSGSVRGIIVEDIDNDGVGDLIAARDTEVSTRLQDTTDGIAPLLEFSLGTLADSRQALSRFGVVLNNLSEQRGIIGAFQSRIESARAVLSATTENYATAESRIRDADIASETSQLVRLNISQQAAAAVLSQANLQPQLALQLLR